MKRRLGIVVVVLALALMSATGYAMPIKLSEGKAALPATTLDGEPYSLEASQFQLIGQDDDGYLVYGDKRILKTSRSNLLQVAGAISDATLAALPTVNSYTTLEKGDKGDKVVKMQTGLKKAGYLDGSADGDFGPGTERAVTNFQERMGLKATGVADAYTQMLIDSMAASEVSVDVKADPKMRFASIANKTDADLTVAVDQNLTLNYDDISGTGMISNNNSIQYSVPSAADIDKCDFVVHFGLKINQGSDGVITIDPAMEVTSVSVRRPVIQEVTLKSGDERYTLPVTTLKSSISGVKSKELATIVMDKTVASMLAKCADKGELKIRITCKYNSYDITVAKESLKAISDIGKAGEAL